MTIKHRSDLHNDFVVSLYNCDMTAEVSYGSDLAIVGNNPTWWVLFVTVAKSLVNFLV